MTATITAQDALKARVEDQPALKHRDRAVLRFLASRASDGETARAAIREIASNTQMDPKTVRRSVAWLAENHVVIVVNRRLTDGTALPNEYIITPDELDRLTEWAVITSDIPIPTS